MEFRSAYTQDEVNAKKTSVGFPLTALIKECREKDCSRHHRD